MNKRFKYLLLLPMTAIVSCGYSTSYLVEGDRYTSAKFDRNYYTHWDNELKNAKKVGATDVNDKTMIREINYGYDSHELIGIEQVDPNFIIDKAPDVDEYGEEFKMNSVDDSFNYGYQSKLFDGQMVCGGQNYHPEYLTVKGRVQIMESGFSARFNKESSKLNYFAMQFKASTDNTKDCYLIDDTATEPHGHTDQDLFHDSTVTLTVTLYVKNSKGTIEGHPFIFDVDFVGTVIQGSDSHGNPVYNQKTNNGHVYEFVAFSLEDYNLSRLIGVSVTYTIQDELVKQNKEKGVDLGYALFLYEMFFPYTNWN